MGLILLGKQSPSVDPGRLLNKVKNQRLLTKNLDPRESPGKSNLKKKAKTNLIGEAWEGDNAESKRDSVFENSVSKSVLRSIKQVEQIPPYEEPRVSSRAEYLMALPYMSKTQEEDRQPLYPRDHFMAYLEQPLSKAEIAGNK
jgi:hypothetical protein